VVRGEGGLILVDPGIDGSDLNQLADDVDRLGIPVVAGFSTLPLGPRSGIPGSATCRATPPPPPPPALPVKPGSGGSRWRRKARQASLWSCSGSSPRCPPTAGPCRARSSSIRRTPMRRGSTGWGRPPGTSMSWSPAARRCRGSRGGGPPRRRSCLHRRAAARRGADRRAPGAGLAPHPPVEPGAGPKAVGPSNCATEHRHLSSRYIDPIYIREAAVCPAGSCMTPSEPLTP